MPDTSSDELDLACLRALARKKPRTKAGQVRQAWPEIRELLAAGHTLKDVCAWVNEIGIEIGYARLPDSRDSRSALPTTPPATSTPQAVDAGRTKEVHAQHDPLANLRRGEARRPGFHYRPAGPADEKDLI